MATPRELVCQVCWDGLFNTQAYQDFLAPPNSASENPLPRQVVQRTTSRHVRDNCPFVTIRRDIASSETIPKPEYEGVGIETRSKCNWCEYIGCYSCCELDEDGNAPEDDQDLLEISLETHRVDCSTPLTTPHAGSKVMMFSLERRDRKTGQSLVGNGSLHHAYTPADDPAARVVVSRPVRSILDGLEATYQIESWVHECESHNCGKDGGFYRESILPTRVIDIGLNGTEKPRVVETHGAKGVYATLSYCWGRQQNKTLCRHNVQQLQHEIHIEELPQTIRDAVEVTRKMSIPYLWVDALCIVQDDEIEKAKEIASMQDIYSNSAVTIVASSASGAEKGFLSLPKDSLLGYQPRKPTVIPVRLGPDEFGSMTFVDLNNWICYAENREPISSRAWTTQEQLLAQRKIIFTEHNHTMSWSCPHSPVARNFGGSMHLPYWPGNFSGREDDFLRETLNLSALAPGPATMNPSERLDKDKALSCWLRLVTVYSLRSASLQVDKLNALAGIAARCYAPLLGPGYFAGMWQYEVLRQLMWKTSDFHESLPYGKVAVTRPLLGDGISRAPSWSWASVEGGVVEYGKFSPAQKNVESGIPGEKEEWMSDVIDVAATPKFESNIFGEIKPGSGYITLRTKLRRAWWHPPSHSIFRHSCAPTPSRSPTSSSDEYSDIESEQLSPSISKPASDGPFGKEVEGGRVHLQTDGGTNGDWSESDSSSEPEPEHREIPTFDMITNRTIGGPIYVSPFKRVLRRTGPLPADSDSEYDSEPDDETTSNIPQDGDPRTRPQTRDRDRTWWWLVNASLDEITTEDDQYDDGWLARKDFENDSVDPYVVYMLPLLATSQEYPHGHAHGRHRARDELVQGLILVKDKVTDHKGEDEPEAADDERRDGAVFFKRIGHFSGCPKKQFENSPIRSVTII